MKPLGVELLSDLENNSVKEINKTEGSEDVTLANNTVLEETKHVSRICTSVDGVDSTVGSKLSSPSQLPIMNGNIKQETSLRLKDKYCQRRVSAIRDFPPLCGRNFPRPIEEEQQRVTCGNDGLDGFEKVDMKMEAIKKKSVLDGVEKFDVETESTKTLKDGSGDRVPWGELLTGNAKPVVFQETLRSTVEGELMKETMGGGVGKLGAGLRDDDIEKTELRGPMPGSRTIPRSVLDNCDEDAGGSVRKEIVVYSQT
ncbi:Uncharacterized protein Adt_18284 [Abeliophyllum distichum]|uniref:Uncharacterized protein n=1 Tax=Abeliophyllum distichum TaxID=126358 RepID=A0ABD1NV33_9LAMI